MEIKKIDDIIKSHQPKPCTKQVGVMGLCLGEELHTRLKHFAYVNKVKMSVIIKTLLITYLDEKEVGE
tara:strand:- start:281 stop:484 length:204 start_codon:yes stop_codon:yes gene_type:complete